MSFPHTLSLSTLLLCYPHLSLHPIRQVPTLNICSSVTQLLLGNIYFRFRRKSRKTVLECLDCVATVWHGCLVLEFHDYNMIIVVNSGTKWFNSESLDRIRKFFFTVLSFVIVLLSLALIRQPPSTNPGKREEKAARILRERHLHF